MKNLHQILIMAIILFITSNSYAQQTPQFQMTLHFEDGMGNRDSIIVGYDESASYGQLNPQFGEALIEAPFDSIFEVRALHAFNSEPTPETSKKIIGSFDTSPEIPCGAMEFIRIIISAQHFPITVSWDTSVLNLDTCRANTILCPDLFLFNYENWQDAQMIHCLAGGEQIVDDFEYYFEHPPGAWFSEEVPVEGKGVVALPGYYFGFFTKFDNYCADITDTEPEPDGAPAARLYPNPTHTSSAILDLGKVVAEAQFVLCNLSGQRLRQFSASGQQVIPIDLGGLPTGIYFVGVSDGQSRPVYHKLVRQ